MSTISEIFNRTISENIDEKLKYALSTGTWGKRKNVSNTLQHCSMLQYIAFMRRIDATHKTIQPIDNLDDIPPLEDLPD
jgi:DNA-directed RNA polymerase beta subunit